MSGSFDTERVAQSKPNSAQ